MNLLEHVKARGYATRAEWIADLHRFGDQAEASAKALRQARTERQQAQREEAHEAELLAGQALSWFEYRTWPTPTHRGLDAVVKHISAAIADSEAT